MQELPPSLDGCWTKLRRADEHLVVLAEELRQFFESGPYQTIITRENDSPWHSLRLQILHPPPLRWGAIVGDFVHNTRSALDHLVWQLVRVNGQEPGRWNDFPIYTDKEAFQNRVVTPRLKHSCGQKSGQLGGVDNRSVEMIRDVQPFNRKDKPDLHQLSVLNELWNIDKHRMLHPILIARDATPPELSFAGDDCVADVRWNTQPLVDGAEVLRIRLWPENPEPTVTLGGSIPVQVAFSRFRLDHNDLVNLASRVASFIKTFESAFQS